MVGLIGFWVFGPEPKGLTFDEIDRALDGPVFTARPGAQTAGNDPRGPQQRFWIPSLLRRRAVLNYGDAAVGPEVILNPCEPILKILTGRPTPPFCWVDASNAIDDRREPSPRQAEQLCPDLRPGVPRIQAPRGKEAPPLWRVASSRRHVAREQWPSKADHKKAE